MYICMYLDFMVCPPMKCVPRDASFDSKKKTLAHHLDNREWGNHWFDSLLLIMSRCGEKNLITFDLVISESILHKMLWFPRNMFHSLSLLGFCLWFFCSLLASEGCSAWELGYRKTCHNLLSDSNSSSLLLSASLFPRELQDEVWRTDAMLGRCMSMLKVKWLCFSSWSQTSGILVC